MKMVVEANILLSAIIKDSITRRLVLLNLFELYAPPELLVEVLEHVNSDADVRRKTGLETRELLIIFYSIVANIKIVQRKEFSKKISEAKTLAAHVEDAPYIALSLKLDCPIWTNDNDMLREKKLKTISTKELIKQIGWKTK